jgi:hypothetical protein
MADKRTEEKGDGKNPLLEESQGPDRKGKYLVLGARRQGGQMAVIGFETELATAVAQQSILTKTGWACVEIYTRVDKA